MIENDTAEKGSYAKGEIKNDLFEEPSNSELPELSIANFQKLGQPACAVFAWRSAMRALPLMVQDNDDLGLWPAGVRAVNLDATLVALDAVLPILYPEEVGPNVKDMADDVVRAASNAVGVARVSARGSDKVSARSVIRAIDRAIGAVRATDTKKAAERANAAVRAVLDAQVDIYSNSLVNNMKLDLKQLLEWRRDSTQGAVPPIKLAVFALWEKDDQPDEWRVALDRWPQVMEDNGHGEFTNSYMSFLSGKNWEVAPGFNRFKRWYNALHVGSEQEKKIIRLAGRAGIKTDEVATEDRLGREALVKALKAILSYEKYPGRMTIGLLGHWGAGKSSVLELLEKEIKVAHKEDSSSPEFLFATFNAWAYEHTNNIQAGMAQEVVNGLTQGLGSRHRLDLAERYALLTEPYKYIFTLLAISVFWGIVIYLTVTDSANSGWAAFSAALVTLVAFIHKTKTVFSHPLARSLKTYLRLPAFGKYLGELPIIREQVRVLCDLVLNPKKDEDETVHEGGLFRKDKLSFFQRVWISFNSQVKNWIECFARRRSKERRLLFMIDDLDRCSVKGVVKTLEAVNLVMGRPNVTTIIAIDHRVALAALSVNYYELADKGSDRTPHAIARDYLGKIFNLPIVLEEPGKESLKKFIDGVLFKDVAKDQKSEGDDKGLSSDANEVDTTIPRGTPKSSAGGEEKRGINQVLEEPGVGSESAELDGKNSADNSETRDPSIDGFERSENDNESADVNEKTKQATEIIERDAINEVIKDTEDEQEQFCELASCLNLVNPRQLKRLHNSYRLLKAIEFHRTENSPQESDRNHFHLMTMLFWLEYVSCLDVKQREVEERFLLGSDIEEGVGIKLDVNVYDQVRKGFGNKNLVEKKSFEQNKKYVETFMLPCADVNGETEEERVEQLQIKAIKKAWREMVNPD